MKLLVVDGDRESLARMERSLESAFPAADIVPFSDALSAYKYCVNHAGEIGAVFVPVVLRPIDGLKLSELISTLPTPIRVVFTLREECAELLELVRAYGARRYIVKPVTPEKAACLAREMAADGWPEGDNRETCGLGREKRRAAPDAARAGSA